MFLPLGTKGLERFFLVGEARPLGFGILVGDGMGGGGGCVRYELCIVLWVGVWDCGTGDVAGEEDKGHVLSRSCRKTHVRSRKSIAVMACWMTGERVNYT